MIRGLGSGIGRVLKSIKENAMEDRIMEAPGMSLLIGHCLSNREDLAF